MLSCLLRSLPALSIFGGAGGGAGPDEPAEDRGGGGVGRGHAAGAGAGNGGERAWAAAQHNRQLRRGAASLPALASHPRQGEVQLQEAGEHIPQVRSNHRRQESKGVTMIPVSRMPWFLPFLHVEGMCPFL
eukprot:2114389-Pyramimonas_sp.AAC.2